MFAFPDVLHDLLNMGSNCW